MCANFIIMCSLFIIIVFSQFQKHSGYFAVTGYENILAILPSQGLRGTGQLCSVMTVSHVMYVITYTLCDVLCCFRRVILKLIVSNSAYSNHSQAVVLEP